MTTAPRLSVTVARDLPGVARLRDGWLSLRTRRRESALNAEPSHYASVIESLGADAAPEVAVFHDGDGRPRALVAARRSRESQRHRIGYVALRGPRLRRLCVVHGGLLTDGTPGAAAAVVEWLRGRLRDGDLDQVMINRLPLDHELAGAMTDAALFPGALRERPERHWRFDFAEGPFEATLRRFSRKHRYNLRRAGRQLAAGGGDGAAPARLRIVTEPADLGAFAEFAASVTAAGYQGRLGAGYLDRPVQRALLLAAASAGRLRAYMLGDGDERIAFQAGIVADDVYHLLFTAYHPRFARHSPGQVLLLRAMEDMHAAGVSSIDYGFGDAPYKDTYGTGSRLEATVHLYAPTPRARAARAAHRLIESADRGARAAAERLVGLGLVRRRWRSLLLPADG